MHKNDYSTLRAKEKNNKKKNIISGWRVLRTLFRAVHCRTRCTCHRFSLDLFIRSKQEYRKSYALRSPWVHSRSARPSLSYDSSNELRYVSRLTKAAITYVRARRSGRASPALDSRLRRIFLSLAPSMTPSRRATDFLTRAFAIAAIYAVYIGIFSLCRPTSE